MTIAQMVQHRRQGKVYVNPYGTPGMRKNATKFRKGHVELIPLAFYFINKFFIKLNRAP